MNHELIQVQSQTTGETVDANLAKCDKCGGMKFYVYTIHHAVWGKRLHFQCEYCGVSFCSGHTCLGNN